MDSRDRGKLIRAGFRVFRIRPTLTSCEMQRRTYEIWVLVPSDTPSGQSWRKHRDKLSQTAASREWEALMADERNIGDV